MALFCRLISTIFSKENYAAQEPPRTSVGRNVINSAQLHSAAPGGDERVDCDNFRLSEEYATPITDC